MVEIISTTFKVKRATHNVWMTLNPILEDGEPGFVLDKYLLKIGDGVSDWKHLPYCNAELALSTDGESICIKSNGTLMVYGFDNAKINQIPYKDPNGKIVWKDISLRRDVYYNYDKIQDTFIPDNGEVCFIDTQYDGLRTIVGDGVTTFKDLDFQDNYYIAGYFNNVDNLFYKDLEMTELCDKRTNRLYVDVNNNCIYYYNGNNYQLLSSGEGGSSVIPLANASTAGIMKLYNELGFNTDGTVTQKKITEELNDKIEVELDKESETLIFTL